MKYPLTCPYCKQKSKWAKSPIQELFPEIPAMGVCLNCGESFAAYFLPKKGRFKVKFWAITIDEFLMLQPEMPHKNKFRELCIREVNVSKKEECAEDERRCRVCGCIEDDCSQCIEKTGEPCYWVEWDLCSACADEIQEGGVS